MEGEQFGMERLMDVLRTFRSRSAEEMVDHVLARVAEYTGDVGFDDDLTLIVVKATGETTPE